MSIVHPIAVRSLVAVVVLVAIASFVPPVGASHAGAAADGSSGTNSVAPDPQSVYVQPGDPGYRPDPVEPSTLPADVPADLSRHPHGQFGFTLGDGFADHAGDGYLEQGSRTEYAGEDIVWYRPSGTDGTEEVVDRGRLVARDGSASVADADSAGDVETEYSSSPYYHSPAWSTSDGADESGVGELPIQLDGHYDTPTMQDDPRVAYPSTVDESPRAVYGVPSLRVAPRPLEQGYELSDGAGSVSEPAFTGPFERLSAWTHVARGDHAVPGTWDPELSGYERPADEMGSAGAGAGARGNEDVVVDAPTASPLVPIAAGGIWLLSLLGSGVLVVRRLRDDAVQPSRTAPPAAFDPGSRSDGAESGTDRNPSTGTGQRAEGSSPRADPDPPDGGGPSVAEPPLPDEDLAPNDYVVERLLESAGGRLKQGHIVEATGWSKSKVSRVLSAMDEAGTVVKVQLGRENVICLDGHEPDVVA